VFGIMDGVGTFFNLTALIPESDRSILNPLSSHLGPERPLAFCFGGLAWVSFGYGLALRALRILHLRGVEVVAGYLFPSPLIRCLSFSCPGYGWIDPRRLCKWDFASSKFGGGGSVDDKW